MILGSTAAAMLLSATPSSAIAVSQPRDCDANAVVNCGAYTIAELKSKLQKGDGRNSAANLQKIYYHENRGIAPKELDKVVEGKVTKDGRVIVNGKVVATNAQSTGREFMPGSTKSGSIYSRPTSASFRSAELPAYVHMEGGKFDWAVLKVCGNTVSAKPVEQPVKPKPETEKPKPEAPKPEAPKPEAPKPETPAPIVEAPAPVLPETGVGLLNLLGLTTLGAASTAYLRSRRNR